MVAQRYILLVGVIKSMNLKCDFGNSYGSKDDREQHVFWEELGYVIKGIEIP